MARCVSNGSQRAAQECGQAVAALATQAKASRVKPSCRNRVEPLSPTSSPADGVAGPERARNARWVEATGASRRRAAARMSRKGNEPSFLRAIAEELAAFRQTSARLMMDEARRLLNEAFLVVECNVRVPSGASTRAGRVERS